MQGVAYVFGSFQFSPTERLLLDDGRPAQLGSHALGILIALVGSARETVSNAEIRLTRDHSHSAAATQNTQFTHKQPLSLPGIQYGDGDANFE